MINLATQVVLAATETDSHEELAELIQRVFTIPENWYFNTRDRIIFVDEVCRQLVAYTDSLPADHHLNEAAQMFRQAASKSGDLDNIGQRN